MNIDRITQSLYIMCELLRTKADKETIEQVIKAIEQDLKAIKKEIAKGEE